MHKYNINIILSNIFLYIGLFFGVVSYCFSQDKPALTEKIAAMPVEELTVLKEVPINLGSIPLSPEFVRYNKYDKNIYISDRRNHRIIVFDTDLNYKTQFGTLGQGKGEFRSPAGIAFTSNGYIIVAEKRNTRCQIFNKEYNYINQYEAFSYNGDIETDSQDRIYANLPSDSSLITVFDINWKKLERFGKIYDYPRDMRLIPEYNGILYEVDNNDNLYCIFTETCIIRRYDSNHNLIFEVDYSFIPPVFERYIEVRKEYEQEDINYTGLIMHKYLSYFSLDENYLYIKCRDGITYMFDKNDMTFIKKVNIPAAVFDCILPEYIISVGPGLKIIKKGT